MASRVTRLVQPAITASAASAGGRRRIRAISMDVTGTMVQFNGKIEVSSCSGWNRLAAFMPRVLLLTCSQNNLKSFDFFSRIGPLWPGRKMVRRCSVLLRSGVHSLLIRSGVQGNKFQIPLLWQLVHVGQTVVEGVRHPMPGAERCQDDSRSGGESLSASLQHLWIACDVQCLSGRPAIPQLGTSTGNHLRRCIECR